MFSLAMGRGVVFTGPPPVSTAPAAFTAGQWSVADAATGGTATVTISALPSNGGSAITAIQYKVGAGAWTNSGIASTGTFNITGLTNGAAVNVLVRAVNAIGNGPDSDTKSVTPAAAVPFTYDANTYWWDFRASDNLSDALGYTTTGFVRERTGDRLTLSENVKDYQPIPEAHGLNFNSSSQRRLTNEGLIPITKGGKNGIYVGVVFRPTVAVGGTILGITGPSGTTLSRLWLDFTSSRLLRARFGPGDSGTGTTPYTSAALTLDAPYAAELQLDFDADLPSAWLNGAAAAGLVGAAWNNYPDSYPLSLVVGNGAAGNNSYEGNLDTLIIYNGVPSAAMRQSFGDYLNARRLAN